MQPIATPPTAPGRGGRSPLKAMLAWLLQLDQPVPSRSEGELAAEINRNYGWNFTFNVLDGVAFLFGYSFVSATTILPLFLSKLTTHPAAFGLLAVINQAGWFLPQLLTANVMERLARKKPVVVNLGLFLERLPFLVIVAAPLVAPRSPGLALALLLGGFAWHVFGAGAVAISWQDLIARCFPTDRRGRFFGTQAFLGNAAGAFGALLCAWMLDRFAYPSGFTYSFALAAGSIMLSWSFLALVREPVRPAEASRRSIRAYAAGLPGLLRDDHNFRRFLAARLLMALGGMGSGFVVVSVVSRWQVPDSAAGAYTLAFLVGQTAANLSFGLLADRFGHKLCLVLGCTCGLTGFALAWLATGPAWFYAVFVLLGIAQGAVTVPGILIVLEFGNPARRSTYVGIANTAVGVAGAAAPLLGTALTGLGYRAVFAGSAAAYLAALALFRWWVREPRHAGEE